MDPKWIQNGSKMGPKWVQNGSKNGSKMGPKCVQDGFKIIQNQSRMFKILAQNWPKMSPKTFNREHSCPAVRAHWPQPCAELAHTCPAIAPPNCGSGPQLPDPKRVQKWVKIAPNYNPKLAQNWSKMNFKIDSQLPRVSLHSSRRPFGHGHRVSPHSWRRPIPVHTPAR